jgi:hypothetical protein
MPRWSRRSQPSASIAKAHADLVDFFLRRLLRTPLPQRQCKARSIPIFGWPGEVSALLKRVVGVDEAAEAQWRSRWETPEISEKPPTPRIMTERRGESRGAEGTRRRRDRETGGGERADSCSAPDGRAIKGAAVPGRRPGPGRGCGGSETSGSPDRPCALPGFRTAPPPSGSAVARRSGPGQTPPRGIVCSMADVPD